MSKQINARKLAVLYQFLSTEARTLTPAEQLTFIVILADAHGHSLTACTAQETICDRVDFGRRKVQQAINELRRRGLITRVHLGGHAKNQRRSLNVYKVRAPLPVYSSKNATFQDETLFPAKKTRSVFTTKCALPNRYENPPLTRTVLPAAALTHGDPAANASPRACGPQQHPTLQPQKTIAEILSEKLHQAISLDTTTTTKT